MEKRERLELFTTLHKPQVREMEREDGKKCRQFEGYAIVFNEPSVVMVDWWEGKTFREYILPEAISQEMLDSTDIVCTAFHNREKLLARHHADGSGTMTLEKDEVGVKVCFEFPDGPTGKDIAEAVSRGDMPGMSFSFYEDSYTYTDRKGADGIIDRTIEKLDSIFEVTVASSPAYPGTSASCREAWEGMMSPAESEAEKAAREAAREAAEAEAREAEAMRLSCEKFTRERSLSAIQKELELLELQTKL